MSSSSNEGKMADLDDIKDGKDWGRDRPADTSQFFLKGAAHHDWGMKARMARIFRPDTGRTVMLAFDHGYFQGPTTGLERLDLTIAPLVPHTDVLMGTRGGLRTSIPPESGKPVVLRCSAGLKPTRCVRSSRGPTSGSMERFPMTGFPPTLRNSMSASSPSWSILSLWPQTPSNSMSTSPAGCRLSVPRSPKSPPMVRSCTLPQHQRNSLPR